MNKYQKDIGTLYSTLDELRREIFFRDVFPLADRIEAGPNADGEIRKAVYEAQRNLKVAMDKLLVLSETEATENVEGETVGA